MTDEHDEQDINPEDRYDVLYVKEGDLDILSGMLSGEHYLTAPELHIELMDGRVLVIEGEEGAAVEVRTEP